MPDCECGCGLEARRRFRHGHNVRRPENRALITAGIARGPASPNWVDRPENYSTVHRWLHRNVTKRGSCDACGRVGYTEFANLSGEYRRDPADYVELCTSCHRRFDLRADKTDYDEWKELNGQ